jgi:hypothetical protein
LRPRAHNETRPPRPQERLAQAAAERLDRKYFHPDCKRAARDERKARDKAAHAATAVECEHGVMRCRICFPPNKHK